MNNINKIATKFYFSLLKAATDGIRTVFKVAPMEYPSSVVRQLLINTTGVPTFSISLSDNKYFLTTWERWGEIIDFDLIDQLVYYYDKFDCDNFAFYFASRAAGLYGLNTGGVAYGSIYDKNTNELLGRHAFNIIVTTNDIRAYEPMTDEDCVIEAGKPIVIGGWRYVCDWILLF